MALNPFVPNMPKMKCLYGNNCRRWAEHMLCYFTQIDVAYVFFIEPKPIEPARPKTIAMESDDVVKESNEKEETPLLRTLTKIWKRQFDL